MRTFIIQILGPYTPVTTGQGAGTIDWPFIFAGIILIMTFWVFYKLLLGLFKRFE